MTSNCFEGNHLQNTFDSGGLVNYEFVPPDILRSQDFISQNILLLICIAGGGLPKCRLVGMFAILRYYRQYIWVHEFF